MKITKKPILALLSMILILISLSGCALSKLNIGVTTYPVEYLVKRIAQDRVNILMFSATKTITRAQIAENYQELIEQTDVLFEFSKLEPYFSVYLEEFQEKGVAMIDLTASASVYAFKRYRMTEVEGTRLTLESEYYDDPLFAGVDVYQTDPMLWLDPITMISMAGTIKDWLVAHYPEEKALFESNYEALALELARMDADYQELWSQEIGFVSVTPSFGNWQKAFGIEVFPLIVSRYGVLPTEEQLAVILNDIKTAGIQYIVHEPNLSEDMEALYQRVQTELKLKSVELHTLTFLTDADIESNKNYITLMLENLTTLEGMTPFTTPTSDTK